MTIVSYSDHDSVYESGSGWAVMSLTFRVGVRVRVRLMFRVRVRGKDGQ